MMNVVINTNSFLKKDDKDYAVFFNDCIQQIIINNPTQDFFLIYPAKNNTDSRLQNRFDIITSQHKNLLMRNYWNAYTLPKIISKNKAAVFINFDFTANIKVKIPQCVVVPNCDILTDNGLSKKQILNIFNTCLLLICASETEKMQLVKMYNAPLQKLIVCPLAIDQSFIINEDSDKESTKEKYASGKEYFLFSGEINENNNLINLLKAFSFFKKRQKSNMQLVINSKTVLPDNAFIKSLQSYKYRDEVKIYFDLPPAESFKITAAAYTFIWPAVNNNRYAPVLQAMNYGVPVIVNDTLLMREICEDAAMFTNANSFENIADKMMILFKDENQRNDLISKGKLRCNLYSIQNSCKILWQNLLKCIDTSL